MADQRVQCSRATDLLLMPPTEVVATADKLSISPGGIPTGIAGIDLNGALFMINATVTWHKKVHLTDHETEMIR